ncbi:MAG TPA: hypothetical protein VEA61_05720 [Allosphingosinicella sp.]|nr:hypothetical protein [Allosphingosinicella sp.]
MIRRALIIAVLAAGGFASASAVAAIENDTVMVPLFVQACATGTPSAEAIEARMNAASAWQRLTDTDLAVDEFGTVKSMQPIGDFKKPAGYKQWRRTVDGKEVRVVLAAFEGKGRYKNLCALLVPDVKNALPYLDPFRGAMKAVGLKAKSVDLVHYMEFSGKLADGRKARGDIFSRTRVLQPGDNMHMYLAF